ncbi:MAG: hypothetical protein WKG03_02855 [Telluria sp.]
MPFSVRAERHFFIGGNAAARNCRRKKADPKVGFLFQPCSNYFAAEAASDAAVEAAAEAATAASAATEAAEAATAAAVAASAAAGAGVSTTAGAGAVSTTGATGATTGSSFLAQAARATANRETISKDFFMGFSLINSL